MKVLLKSDGSPLAISQQGAYKPAGEHGWLMDAGQATWVDVPAGELLEDCDYVASPPSVVLNASKKAARLAAASDKSAWVGRIKAFNPDSASQQDQKQFQKDIVLAIKYLIGN